MGARRIDGVDISHHQKDIDIDWAKAKAAGVKFLYHKATEGTTFKDPAYTLRRVQATRNRMPFGAYHFARPNVGDAAAEANFFLDHANPRPGDMVPVLDIETNDNGLTREQITKWVETFVSTVYARLKIKHMLIYTPFELNRRPPGARVWVARYNDDNRLPRTPMPWATWTIWQFSDGQHGDPKRVPGFGDNPVDINTKRRWVRLSALRIPQPVKIPDPYGRTVFNGKPLDNATAAALGELERRLGYREGSLTVYQGIGGADASAGTHTKGRAADLSTNDGRRKLRVAKDIGFAGWYREALPGVWPSHLHLVLIYRSRWNLRGISSTAWRQIQSYLKRRNGLKSNLHDPSYRPDPPAVFTRADYENTFRG